jgi:hypothetical protein
MGTTTSVQWYESRMGGEYLELLLMLTLIILRGGGGGGGVLRF